MGVLNPYVGLKRDDSGYYLDFATAAASPYYKQESQGARLQAANQGGRVNLNDFDVYGPSTAPASPSPGGGQLGDGNQGTQDNTTQFADWNSPVMRGVTDSRFKGQAYSRADQQYQTDKDVARIAQEGREQTRQEQLRNEISMASQQAARTAQRQADDAADPGGPDVNLNTGGPADEGGDDGGNGNTRRKRSAYQGAGLKI